MTKDRRWKLLMATPDDSEAYLIKQILDGEGIACKIESNRSFPGAEHRGNRGEVLVYVPLENFEVSQQILEERDDEDNDSY
jgi:hypothetical protein